MAKYHLIKIYLNKIISNIFICININLMLPTHVVIEIYLRQEEETPSKSVQFSLFQNLNIGGGSGTTPNSTQRHRGMNV